MNLKEKYADLIVRSGLNVQKGQIVVVRANVEMNEFVRLIVKSCFEVGAKDVIVRYSDDEINRMRYLSGIVCLMIMKLCSTMKRLKRELVI